MFAEDEQTKKDWEVEWVAKKRADERDPIPAYQVIDWKNFLAIPRGQKVMVTDDEPEAIVDVNICNLVLKSRDP
jgi:hypothetical protein